MLRARNITGGFTKWGTSQGESQMDNNHQGPAFVWWNSWQRREKMWVQWHQMLSSNISCLLGAINTWQTCRMISGLLSAPWCSPDELQGRILTPELQLSRLLATGSCSELCNLCKPCTTHKTPRSTHKVVSAGMREKTTRLSSCIRVEEVSDCLLALIRGGMSVGPFLQAVSWLLTQPVHCCS